MLSGANLRKKVDRVELTMVILVDWQSYDVTDHSWRDQSPATMWGQMVHVNDTWLPVNDSILLMLTMYLLSCPQDWWIFVVLLVDVYEWCGCRLQQCWLVATVTVTVCNIFVISFYKKSGLNNDKVYKYLRKKKKKESNVKSSLKCESDMLLGSFQSQHGTRFKY